MSFTVDLQEAISELLIWSPLHSLRAARLRVHVSSSAIIHAAQISRSARVINGAHANYAGTGRTVCVSGRQLFQLETTKPTTQGDMHDAHLLYDALAFARTSVTWAKCTIGD